MNIRPIFCHEPGGLAGQLFLGSNGAGIAEARVALGQHRRTQLIPGTV